MSLATATATAASDAPVLSPAPPMPRTLEDTGSTSIRSSNC